MPAIRIGAICLLRGSKDDWRVINTRFDGLVSKYIVQSMHTGEIRCVNHFELFEKYTSTYEELNDFLKQMTGTGLDEDLDFLDEPFETDPLQIQTEESGSNSNPKRFKTTTEDTINKLKAQNTEKTTDAQTRWTVNLLKVWMLENDYPNDNFEIMEDFDLDTALQKFYASLQKKGGKDYSKPSLVSIRAGINRWLTSPPHSRQINIMHDRNFMSSNQVLTGLIKGLKREGKDLSHHKEPICDEDLNKLYQSGLLSEKTPQTLQNKVLFEIIAQFGRRGREGLHQLKKNSFVIKTDPKGRTFVTMAYNEADKTHHGLDSREHAKEPRMYSSEGEYCPVKSFQLYISKLNPNCESFFQRPVRKFNGIEQEIWYENSTVGVNKLSNFMASLSTDACLSNRYTNHCIRASVTTRLHHQGFGNTAIMSVTGHRNVQSLTSYIKTTDDERFNLSKALTYQPSSDTNNSLVTGPVCPIPTNVNVTDTRSDNDNRQFQLFTGAISSSNITVNVYSSK